MKAYVIAPDTQSIDEGAAFQDVEVGIEDLRARTKYL
jgi:hypothetical protein